MQKKIAALFSHPIWSNYKFLLFVWTLLALYTAWKNPEENNFLVFRYVYDHAVQGTSLYVRNPLEYQDQNYYGPFFMLVIAPFAQLPVWLGHALWQLLLMATLYITVRLLPIENKRKVFIMWFCANELLTALFLSQFNIAIAAILLVSCYAVEKERDWLATLAVVVGTFVKLYGIVGIVFFFFSKHKKLYALSLFGWTVLALLLPMLLTSPEYVIEQYREWFVSLQEKNLVNLYAIDENICLLGMIRKIAASVSIGGSAVYALENGTVNITNLPLYSDLWIILPAMLIAAAGFFRIDQWKNTAFRETILADVMMFVVLFSTGSESYGYITPLIGIIIWYTASPWKRGKWDIALLVFVFILTSLSPGDLFPASLRHEWVKPYALKALPVTLVWMKLSYELITKDYGKKKEDNHIAASI